MIISENFSLKQYNTFGFDVKTELFIEIETENDVLELYKSNLLNNRKFIIIGGSSNILFTDNFPGIVVYVNNKGVNIDLHEENFVHISANAGEVWSDFVDKMVDENFGGAENLSLIPGFCGSSAVQNIGAYGVEVCDIIESVRYFNLENGCFETILAADCKFGYRDSIFKHGLKNRAIITSVTYRLTKNHKIINSYSALNQELIRNNIINPTIKDISETIKGIRNSKLPDVTKIGNAGSFFKNPYISIDEFNVLKEKYPQLTAYKIDENTMKLAAGQLIELCGWKGKRIGNVGVHELQALVLVNYGNGTGKDIVSLSNSIIADVRNKFNVTLVPEVIFI